MLKIMLVGGGRMGKTVSECIAQSRDMTLVQCVKSLDEPLFDSDVLVDFSSPKAFKKIYEYCSKNLIPAVIATTGYSEDDYNAIIRLSKKVPVFFSQNMSMGVAAMLAVTKRLSLLLKDCDIDIIERHHRGKADSPSGTAFMLATAIAGDKRLSINTSPSARRGENELNILSLRAGTLVGEHEVVFHMDDESISIKHTASSRKIFAAGALNAVRFIAGQPPGMYGTEDLLM